MITAEISERCVQAKRMLKAHLAVLLRLQLHIFAVIAQAHLRILTMSRNAVTVNLVAMH